MQLVISPTGTVRTLYAETVDLAALGPLHIERGSHVEPDEQGQWRADLSPVSGPLLGPFPLRSQALAAEQAWLEAHWLMPEAIPGSAAALSIVPGDLASPDLIRHSPTYRKE